MTPERIVLEEEVAAVILRTDVGDATFLAGHTPLIGAIVPGLVRFQHEDGSEERVAVHGGFVYVK
ncbi:MAG TPA: F0F1 ATP synthase subunit epsilon, partial [Acidimicrobiales bacterium]|nr:F0F1 ATP synthase subunit epsilon [Acidimicrobiales bacterium]